MIQETKNKTLIHLYNSNISYYVYINKFGFLQNPYFGERLDNLFDLAQLVGTRWPTSYFDKNINEEITLKDGEESYRTDLGNQEIFSHGFNDFRESAIILRKSDGSFESNFKYISHKIYKGIKPLLDLPSADRKLNSLKIQNEENVDTLEILLKDSESSIYLYEFISIYNDKDIIVKSFKVVNNEKDSIKLNRCYSMQMSLNNDDYLVHHFCGSWGNERNEVVNEIVSDCQVIESKQGRSSHYENPFIFLTKKETTYSSGEAIGFNLIWSGNFKFNINKDQNILHSLSIAYGINDYDFEITLKSGDSFETPQAIISYSNKGIDYMSHQFHSFIKENLCIDKNQYGYRPLLLNCWEAVGFDFNTDSLIKFIDKGKEMNIDLFVLDDGWFGHRDSDNSSLGDWYVNKKVDLKKVVDFAHSKGLKFGIWFEPEMISPDSDLYRAHPEYVLGKAENNLLTGRHQLNLDFTNEKVILNVFRQMKKILDKYSIDYVKWDYNREIYEHYSNNLKKNRQGEVLYRQVIGFYKLYEMLKTSYPNLLIEGCAGGGGRFDLGVLYYSPQIWCSDNTNGAKRMYIQYNTSLGYPLSSLGSHLSFYEEADFETRAMIALFGTFGYEFDPSKLTSEQLSICQKYAQIYKENYVDLINEGTLYHLSNPRNSNHMCMEVVNKNKDKAMILYVNKESEMLGGNNFVKFQGLNDKYLYKNDLDNKVYSGEYLRKVGLNIFSNKSYWNAFKGTLIKLNRLEEN